MKKGLPFFILWAVLFASCLNTSNRQTFPRLEIPEAIDRYEPSVITDFQNNEEPMPEWVSRWLSGGIGEVESLAPYQYHYVFVSRNEGSNFNALKAWAQSFSPELDFPRLAAARIQTRLNYSVPLPDFEYGAFYEALIRYAADAPWDGAVMEDTFWLRRKYIPAAEENPVDDIIQPPAQERDAWEFLVLISINKEHFASQLHQIFDNIRPYPSPTRDQAAAISRVKEQFFERF